MKDKEKPWEKLRISRGAWFRAKREGRDPATVRPRASALSPKRPLYKKIKDASAAAKVLKIRTKGEYRRRRSEDLWLHANPDTYYKGKGWKNWGVFLGTKRYRRLARNCYATWQEAAVAAKTLGCTRSSSSIDYRSIWRKDPKLPSRPYEMYEAKGWPGWEKFFSYTPKK